jgi:hypothetical protein
MFLTKLAILTDFQTGLVRFPIAIKSVVPIFAIGAFQMNRFSTNFARHGA